MDLNRQMQSFVKIIKGYEMLYYIFQQVSTLGLPNYYIGAGCLTQTVWNHISGHPHGYGIKDIDIVYCDSTDLDGSKEKKLGEDCQRMLKHTPFEIDVVNQARVHQWYEKEFGIHISPYETTEQAINTWPTTASAIGLRLCGNETTIYAPYGLNDLFGLVVRANKALINQTIYAAKVAKWTKKWPNLTIIPWDSGAVQN